MLSDSTLILLDSSVWFAGGVLVLYVIGLYRVFLTRYFLASGSSGSWIVFPFAKAIFVSKPLHQGTIRYLFRFKEPEWKVNRGWKNTVACGILDCFAAFLKPYILIAFLFALLRFWISTHFAYEELSITLGQVQLFLYEISRIKILLWLKDAEAQIIFLYLVACILIPWLYKHNEVTERGKKLFAFWVFIFSVIINVSFFGSKAGKDVPAKATVLLDLEVKIDSVHNHIFREVATAVVVSEIRERVLNHNAEMVNDANEMKRDVDHFVDSVSSPITSPFFYLREEADRYITTLTSTESMDGDPPDAPASAGTMDYYAPPGDGARWILRALRKENRSKIPPLSKTIIGFYNGELPSDRNTSPKDDNFGNSDSELASEKKSEPSESDPANGKAQQLYIVNRAQWSLGQGQELLKKVTVDIAATAAADERFDKQIKLVQAALDLGLDNMSDYILGRVGAGQHKVLKKFLDGILNDDSKKCISKKVVSIIMSIINRTSYAASFNASCNSANPDVVAERAALKSDWRDWFRVKKADAIRQDKVERIAEMDRIRTLRENRELEEMISRKLKGLTFPLESVQIPKGGTRVSDPYEYRSNIIEQFRSILVPSTEAMSAAGRNELLRRNYQIIQNQQSLDMVGKAMSSRGLFSNIPGICNVCGLPITTPFCLSPAGLTF